MTDLSSTQAAKKLRISVSVLNKYIKQKKIPAPRIVQVGKLKVQAWSEEEIAQLRRLLPKIANGRKTRFQKPREKQGARAKSPSPRKTKKN